MHQRLLTILFLSATVGLSAQSLEKKIPKDAGFVLCLNLNSLSQKINFNDLGNYSFLKKSPNDQGLQPLSVIKELFRLPEKAGINKKDKIYIYSENHDSIHNLSYLIALSDAGLFQSRIVDILKDPISEPKFNKEGKIRVLNRDHKMSIGVGKDYALISIWTPPYYYADDYYQYNEEKNRVIAAIDSMRYAILDIDTVEVISGREEEVIDSVESEIIGMVEETDTTESLTYPQTPYVDYTGIYDNDSLMKEFERKWVIKRKKNEEIFWARHDKKMTLHQKRMSNLKPRDGIAVDNEFLKVFNTANDIIYWFNYGSYSNQIINAVSENNSYKSKYDSSYYKNLMHNPPTNKLAELFDNSTMYGLGNFDKGELKMSFYNSFNPVLKPYIEKIYSNDINPEFFKYIKSDNLMGLVGMSIHSEALADLYYEIFRRATESSVVPNQYVVAAIEMTDLFLDKNVLYHTFKGDAVIAFTGIRSHLRTWTTYEYDTLNFENRSVEKTTTQYIPEFVAILTIENQDNLKRILNMVKKLDGLAEWSKNVYVSKSRRQDIDSSFFLVVKDNLFFITNDKTLATEQIMGGLSSTRTVGDAYKEYLNNCSFGFWDASKMFRLMADGTDDQFGKTDVLHKISDKINKGFFVTKPLTGNVASYEITIEMKNRENSSLLEFLKLFEDLYVLYK